MEWVNAAGRFPMPSVCVCSKAKTRQSEHPSMCVCVCASMCHPHSASVTSIPQLLGELFPHNMKMTVWFTHAWNPHAACSLLPAQGPSCPPPWPDLSPIPSIALYLFLFSLLPLLPQSFAFDSNLCYFSEVTLT